MPSANVKLTLLFQDKGSGWSETGYYTLPSNSTLSKMADDVIKGRVTVLGEGATIVGARATQLTVPRIKAKYEYDSQGEATDGNQQGAKGQKADQASAAILIPFRTASGTLRYYTLSGVPDSWIERAAAPKGVKIAGGGLTALPAYKDWLIKPPFSLQIQERRRGGDGTPKEVKAITQHANGRYQIETTNDHGLAGGDKVVLTNVKGLNVVNTRGVRKVADLVDSKKFTIDAGPRADLGDVIYQAGGRVSKVAYDFAPATISDEPMIITTRKRGRPFAARRGRRSGRR